MVGADRNLAHYQQNQHGPGRYGDGDGSDGGDGRRGEIVFWGQQAPKSLSSAQIAISNPLESLSFRSPHRTTKAKPPSQCLKLWLGTMPGRADTLSKRTRGGLEEAGKHGKSYVIKYFTSVSLYMARRRKLWYRTTKPTTCLQQTVFLSPTACTVFHMHATAARRPHFAIALILFLSFFHSGVQRAARCLLRLSFCICCRHASVCQCQMLSNRQ